MAKIVNGKLMVNLDDGTNQVFQLVEVSTPPPPPPPADLPVPPGVNQIKVGSASFAVAAVNPTAATNPAGVPFAGFRGDGQLVIYAAPTLVTVTNPFGVEVAVIGGAVTLVNDRQTTGSAQGTVVPAGGYLVSAHGRARDWALANLKLGAKVELAKVDVPVPPPVVPGSTGRKILGVYMMDSVGHVSQVPPQCNRILVAFYQGTDLVEWGGDSPNKTAADLKAWQSSRVGNEIIVSLGGQGGTVVLDQVDEGIERINRDRFPVAGIDFDAEAFGYSTSQAVSISQACAQRIGRAPADFVVQFVPPGGDPVAPALAAAKACQDAGFRVSFGQQGYQTQISDADVMSLTRRAVDALGASSVLIGVMIGDSYGSWTAASAESRMRAALAQWPALQGMYLWESSRTGTPEWAARVGPLLGL